MIRLLITADGFGIGVETSRGILDLADRGVVTSAVLLANSPYAEAGVKLWRNRGKPVELGWQPALTIDKPVLQPERVPSLVNAGGQFHTLRGFLKGLIWNRIDEREAELELQAQYDRFLALTGQAPRNVNTHHHIHVFGTVHRALTRILSRQMQAPYLRRVAETRRTLWGVKGARFQRLLFSRFGSRIDSGFPANDALLGLSDPQQVRDPEFFIRWLREARSGTHELACHPGHFDLTLIGRDGTLTDGQLHRRSAEYDRLSDPAFAQALKKFELTTAAGLTGRRHNRAA